MDWENEYLRWKEHATADPELTDELGKMDEAEIEDAFYRDLAFGTGGLRGIIGAGTNRMNIYTVAKASQGLADYLNHTSNATSAADLFTYNNSSGAPSVVIGYDSRLKSDLFARTTASVLAANGIQVNIWPALLPVPAVSFAVRYLRASAGVMITASHNPAQYNGYKVYGVDGCQITTDAAAAILAEIEKLDIFVDVKIEDFNAGVGTGKIRYISENVLTAFIETVKKQSVLFGDEADRDAVIVYSPLNGTGLVPVTRILRETGYTNLVIVKEQEEPDGNFPTCPYPNPEVREAMALGLEYAGRNNADLVLATDPDCDRVGIAVKDRHGKYALLSGNETGILLLDYICSQRVKHGKMPADPIMIKTVVTTDLGERIATHYGVTTRNVLTGFKFIGEQIGLLEKEGKEDSYVFGFEESYGYLIGGYVRDKDGVGAAYLICEMFGYYRARGIRLTDRLHEIYAEYDYCLNTLHSYEFEGSSGNIRMKEIMECFRGGVESIGGKKVLTVLDYSRGLGGLPRSDVLKYLLEDGCSMVVRPSGTEPKLKIYISVCAKDEVEAGKTEAEIVNALKTFIL